MKQLLVILLLLTLVPIVAGAEEYRPYVVAHRGASGYLPEHTLVAKAMAYAMGVDYIEQDVVMTKDGNLMIMHDPILDTTTDVAEKFPDRMRSDGHFFVSDLTYEEVRTLRVKEYFNPTTKKNVYPDRFPDYPIDYRVPTLEEEFYQIQGLNKSTGNNISVYVEVKEPEFFEKQGLDILKATIDTMTKFGYNNKQSKAILQIFDYEAVIRARKLGWKGELCMLLDGFGQLLKNDLARHHWLATEEGIKEISKYATIYAPDFALLAMPNKKKDGYTLSHLEDIARKYGMKVHSWVLRKDSLPEGFKSFEEACDVAFKKVKLDGMFTDFPDLMINYLKENNMR